MMQVTTTQLRESEQPPPTKEGCSVLSPGVQGIPSFLWAHHNTVSPTPFPWPTPFLGIQVTMTIPDSYQDPRRYNEKPNQAHLIMGIALGQYLRLTLDQDSSVDTVDM